MICIVHVLKSANICQKFKYSTDSGTRQKPFWEVKEISCQAFQFLAVNGFKLIPGKGY
jgi:hypothetical protein